MINTLYEILKDLIKASYLLKVRLMEWNLVSAVGSAPVSWK